MTLSYRTAFRLFCAVCALLLAMLGVAVAHAAQTARYRRQLEKLGAGEVSLADFEAAQKEPAGEQPLAVGQARRAALRPIL